MRTHDTISQNTMKSTLYDKVLFYVRLAAHVSNGCKSRIHPAVGRI